MDAQVAADEVINRARGTKRGRKDKDKEDGAVIVLAPLKKKLRNLGQLAQKVADASAALREAEKAIAKETGLLKSVVHRMVKATSGDSDQFEDEKRKAEQISLCFEEISFEGEITKATTDAPQ